MFQEKMKLKQPYYLLHIDAGGGPYSVLINDCPIFSEEEASHTTVELPLNHWLRHGANVLSISQDISVTTANGTVEVRAAEMEKRDQQRISVERMDLLSLPDSPAADGPSIIKMHLLFQVDLPLPRWRWDQLQPGELTQRDKILINNEAYQLWSTLAAGDLERLEALLHLKSNELAQSRYQTMEEREAEVTAQFEPLLNDPNWELQNLDAEDLDYLPCGCQRLVQLVDRFTNNSPISFFNRQTMLTAYIDLFFFEEQQMKWSIIR